MNSVRFTGVYGIVAQSSQSRPRGGHFYELGDVKKALREKALEQNVPLVTDPDERGGHVLSLNKGKVEIPPVASLSSPFFDNKLYVFTQEDAKAYEGFKADVEKYWQAPRRFVDSAERTFNQSFEKMLEISKKMAKKSPFAASIFEKVSLLAFAGAGEVINLMEKLNHRSASNHIRQKWARLLDKLPQESALLPKEAVLQAIAGNGFNVESGAISQ